MSVRLLSMFINPYNKALLEQVLNAGVLQALIPCFAPSRVAIIRKEAIAAISKVT